MRGSRETEGTQAVRGTLGAVPGGRQRVRTAGRVNTGGVGAGRTIKRNAGNVRIESILSLLANPTSAILAGAGGNAITESDAALHEFSTWVNFFRNILEVGLVRIPVDTLQLLKICGFQSVLKPDNHRPSERG